MDEKTALLLRDYGALGVLVTVMGWALAKLWGELKQVRQEADTRVARYLDQIQEVIKENQATTQKHLEALSSTTQKQADAFAGVVREMSNRQADLLAKLIDGKD